MKFTKRCRLSLSNFEVNFSLFCGVTLRNIILLKLHGQLYLKNTFSVRTVLKKFFFFFVIKKCLKNEVEKFKTWQHFLISGKYRPYPFLIFILYYSQIKNYIITGLVSNFFNAPCKRVPFVL